MSKAGSNAFHPRSASFHRALRRATHAALPPACSHRTAVPVQTIEERLPQLAAGAYDVAIAALSFTPGRAAVAHFPRRVPRVPGRPARAASRARLVH